MGFHPLVFAKNGIRAFPTRVRNQMHKFSTTGNRNEKAQVEEKYEEEVVFQNIGKGKGLITLNRPRQLNTLNLTMVTKIRETLLRWKDEKSLIVIKGAGKKAFCAGGDVVAVVKDKTGATGKKFFTEEYKTDALISSLQIPYVAIISGIVMGGGVGMSIFGKYRIATETSMFAMPETQIGLFPDVGVSYKLARMPYNLGNFLALTGYRLKGYDLVHAGIATHFCHTDYLDQLEEELLCEPSKSSSPDEIIKEFHKKSLKDTDIPPFSLRDNLGTIEHWFSGCTVEEILQKISEDDHPIAKDTCEILKRMSPLSLKVTLRQIAEAAKLEPFDCFNMDYRIVVRMLESSDFSEGVRALLIDKDKKFVWRHSDVFQVKDEEVNAFFKRMDESEELNLPVNLHN